MTRRRYSWLLGFGVATLCLAGAELASRLLPKNYYEWQHRYMFLSEGVITNKTLKDGSTTQWYKPNKAINWTVFYGYPFHKPKLEYSVWLTSNDIGLIQSRNFEPAKESIAIFGDSFTEPQATNPWFYSLENHWNSISPNSNFQLLNFGYQGTGIGRWDQITNNLKDDYKIKKAVYVAISQDFARLNQSGWSEGDLDCFDTTKSCPGLYYQPILGNDQSTKTLRTRASQEIAGRHHQLNDRITFALCGSSELLRQVSSLTGKPCYKSPPTEYQTSLQQQMGTGFYFFKKHIELYGKENVHLVWIPERNEAATGNKSPLSRKLIRFAGNHIPKENIILCELGPNDYHEKDGHQNEEGSRKIYKCVSQSLEKMNKE